MEVPKKEFDSTVCFMFFQDWMEAIESSETETDMQSESYMLFKAIANYSLYGEEPDFEHCEANRSFKRFWPMISRQIDDSIKNRRRGFRSGSTTSENAKKVMEAYREDPYASVRQIAEKTGISKSEVGRLKRKYLSSDVVSPNPVPGDNSNSAPGDNSNSAPDTCPYTNTSTGHGTERDTGQHVFSPSGKNMEHEELCSTKNKLREGGMTDVGVTHPPTPLQYGSDRFSWCKQAGLDERIRAFDELMEKQDRISGPLSIGEQDMLNMLYSCTHSDLEKRAGQTKDEFLKACRQRFGIKYTCKSYPF